MARDGGEGEQGGAVEPAKKVRAWDVPTRFFHWTLVLLLISAYITRFCGSEKTFWYSVELAAICGDDELFWHKANGYAVLTLITFRLIWGFIGGSTARFSAFAAWPWTAAAYGLDFLRRRPRNFLGHNPLGGLVVFAMLGVIAFQCISGLFSNDDVLAEGPLRNLVSDAASAEWTRYHLWNFDLILILVGVHITASVLYYVWKKENLVKSMFTGRKEKARFEDQDEASFGSPMLALGWLVLAAVIVLGGIKLAGGQLF